MRKAEANKTTSVKETFGIYVPEIKDYTLKQEFQDPFKSLPKVSVLNALCRALGF